MKDLTEWQPRLEPVRFEVLHDELHLLYTVAVPLSAPLLDSEGRLQDISEYKDDWTRLGRADVAADPLAGLTREHWRRNLQETDAVLSLLPKYFTSPQARSIYESLWGKELDPGNFTKWMVQQNRMCEVVEDAELSIRGELDAFAATRLARGRGLAGVSLAKAVPQSMIGVSPFIIAAGVLGAPLGTAVGAAAAGLVAYQAKPQPGRRPAWYTARRDPSHGHVLKHVYVPRPVWRH
ncbi:hypothetical protein JAAN108728_01020 [Janibacter anophelis]